MAGDPAWIRTGGEGFCPTVYPGLRRVSLGLDRKACPFSSPSNPFCVLLFASLFFASRYLYEKTRPFRTIGPVSPLAPRNPGDHVTRCGSTLPYREQTYFVFVQRLYTRIKRIGNLFLYIPLLLCCYGSQVHVTLLRRKKGAIGFALLSEALMNRRFHRWKGISWPRRGRAPDTQRQRSHKSQAGGERHPGEDELAENPAGTFALIRYLIMGFARGRRRSPLFSFDHPL